MNELDRILEAVTDWSQRGVDFALATVVGVKGSTYRGLGARQLVAADGAAVGTVSGGCLDQDLHRVVERVVASRRPELVVFDLTADDEAIWGWGIGCNGATELWVEPADSALDWARRVAQARGQQRPLAVVHDLDDGRRLYVEGTGEASGALADDELVQGAVEAAGEALQEGETRRVTVGGHSLLVEVVGAPPRLVVCGAGHDAAPLVRFAVELGFEVLVVDDRRHVLTQERFPEASALVHAHPRELPKVVDLDSRTFVVLMTHNYLRDLDYVRALAGSRVPYVGVLGPGARLERILKDLEAEGVEPTEADLARLHGPAGLDIGAEGPTEIAWSILAEVLAVRHRREGGMLRWRKGPDRVRRVR